MEPEGSLRCLQAPPAGPYPETHESSPLCPIIFSLWGFASCCVYNWNDYK
jgi:hypothetical protein